MRTATAFLLLGSAAWGQAAGTVRYLDRTYGPSGFTGEAWRLCRQVQVEIVDADDDFTILGSDWTNESGVYSIGGLPPNKNVFLRVYARSRPTVRDVVVKDSPSSGAVLTAASADATTNGAGGVTINFDIGTGSFYSIAGPFNILDMGLWAVDYLTVPLGVGLASVPPLTLYWFPESTNGTYFSKSQNAVFLLGKTSDPDEYDDDIILHEIGHWVAYNFSKDDSPGGPHTIIDQKDVRLAWSEGWAHYWSSTVRRYAGGGLYADPDGFVDNFGTGNSYFEIDTPSLAAQTVTAANEIAVANGLWKLTQPPLGVPQLQVWTAVVDIKTQNLPQVSLEDFRNRWEFLLSGTVDGTSANADYLAAFSESGPTGTFTARLIRHYRDSDDVPQNNSAPGVVVGGFPYSTTQRTIFAAGDQDWYTVTLPTGLVHAETLNLKDGCDTVIDITDAAGSPLATNDDRTPSDPSSSLDFQIGVAGTYRIRVTAFSGAGAITEHGYYDLLVETSANAIPTIQTATASPASGTAPMRVSFAASASDVDGSIQLYEWDFDGDGKYDYSSIQGGNVVHTYDRGGTFVATLRVTDSGARTAFATIVIDAAAPAPSVSLEATFTSTTAPAAVTYKIDVSGVVPVSYEWDFDGDGVVDAASAATNSADVVYRIPTSIIAAGYVTDREGRRFRAAGPMIVISPGGLPPSITSFTAASPTGAVPHSTILAVVAGAVTRVEWDFNGDGRYDLDSGSMTAVLHQYQRVGTFAARVRVTNAAGLSATATTTVTTTAGAVAGWLVEPREGDRITGSGVTLTAEAAPRGAMKKVQFQYRTNFPVGSWVDIGPPIFSDGTRFSVRWDTGALPSLAAFDLRILVDDSVSSGDPDNTVTIDPVLPDVAESGETKDRVVRGGRTTMFRSAAGVEAIVPGDALPSGTTMTIRMEPGPSPWANGSAIEGRQVSTSYRLAAVSGATPFGNAIVLRLPIPAGTDASRIEIHRFDEQAGVWRRDFPTTVRADEGLAETRAVGLGVFALFVMSGGDDGGRSACFAIAAAKWLAFPALPFFLGMLWLISWRRWRSSRS